MKKCGVPGFFGLTRESMVDWARLNAPDVMRAFPIRDEIDKLHRQYIADVIHTLAGKPFKDWVESQTNQRHEKVIEKLDQAVYMDAECYEAFKKSKAVSGKS